MLWDILLRLIGCIFIFAYFLHSVNELLYLPEQEEDTIVMKLLYCYEAYASAASKGRWVAQKKCGMNSSGPVRTASWPNQVFWDASKLSNIVLTLLGLVWQNIAVLRSCSK